MNHPSCIKIPSSKESLPDPANSYKKDADIRDQICMRTDLIDMANEVFGDDKWSHSVTSQTLDFAEYITGKYYVGCAAFVRVQLTNGTYHEDLGYSNSDGPNKGLVIFSARTGSITNALKNTLMCFGGEMAIKIKTFIKLKTNEPNSIYISTIGEPQRIVHSGSKIPPPCAQSTPQKRSPVPLSVAPAPTKDCQPEIVRDHVNEKNTHSSPRSRIIETVANGNKPALTDEERRMERKRRQAQKQEEYKKQLKEKELAEKPNPRF